MRLLLSAADLDTSFGSGGSQIQNLSSEAGGANAAVAMQPDGKVVVAGMTSTTQFCVARYDTNGALDPTFGIGGQRSFAVGKYSAAYAVALQTDGKIVLAGATLAHAELGGYAQNPQQMAVVRLNADGSPDNSFGRDGIVEVQVQAWSGADAVAIAGDGKILLGGLSGTKVNTGASSDAVVRLNPDGTLDPSFGSGGMAIANFLPSENTIAAITIDSAGGIDVAGWGAVSSPNFEDTLARYLPNGTLDPAFGNGGVVVWSLSNLDRAFAIATAPGGKLVVAGSAQVTASDVISVFRFNANGTPDSTFGTSGAATMNTGGGGGGSGQALSVMPDGRIVVAGGTNTHSFTSAPQYIVTVARFTAAGKADTSFNSTGFVSGPASGIFDAVALTGNGSVVCAGYADTNYDDTPLVARYTPAGVLDTGFHGGVVKELATFGSTSAAAAAVLQPDGKLLVAGNTDSGRPDLVRYNVDGSSDSGFGEAGQPGSGPIYALALQSDGKILACFSDAEWGVERFNTDGTPDTTFGIGGIDYISPPVGAAPFGVLNAIAALPTGQILIAGSAGTNGGNTSSALARLTPTGALDTTFGNKGIALTSFGSTGSSSALAMALDGAGRIVLDGSVQTASGTFCALARYTTTGQLDASFGSNGIALTTDPYARKSSLAIAPDGKIVMVSASADSAAGGATVHWALDRFTSSGAMDASFGFGGSVTGSGAADGLQVMPDGSILIAGDSGTGVPLLARFTAAGKPDDTFGNNSNAATASFGTLASAAAIAVRPDGKILIAGSTNSKAPTGAFAMFVAQYQGTPTPIANTVNGLVGVSNTFTLRREPASTLDDIWINAPATGAASAIADPSQPITIVSGGQRDLLVLDAANGSPLGAKLILDGSFQTGDLSIGANQNITLAASPAPPNTLTATSLVIDSAGSLDVGNNGVIINYTGNSSPLATLASDVKTGYDGGTWAGNGIRSSTAAANPGHGAVGYGEASTLLRISGAQTGLFMGQAVVASSILLRYTAPGDANLDGKVDFSDFVTLSSHFGQNASSGWDLGDFNYDGVINFADFILLSSNFGRSVAQPAAPLARAARRQSQASQSAPRFARTPSVAPARRIALNAAGPGASS